MKKITKLFLVIIFLLIVFCIYVIKDLDKNKLEEFVEVNFEIQENDINKANVSDAQSFLNALENDNINIIEIENDLDFGYNILKDKGINSNLIKKPKQPLTHPILKQTGISKIRIENKDGLYIYSKLGCKILHTNFLIQNSKNIKIDNLKFEELWEWDENTKASFSRNDWDCITIKNSENINIKNCEFCKTYDGITDINNCKNITIEYCKLVDTDIENDLFFNAQFEELENNIDNYPMYKFLRKDIGLDINKIKELSSYQFKLFTIGTKDNCEKNENIVIHDNLFLHIKTRIPLARNSSIYLYNNYADQSNMNIDDIINVDDLKKIKKKYKKIVTLSTFGVIAIQRSYVVLENNFFNEVKHKYTFSRGFSINNLGKIVLKSEAKDASKLKEMLLDEVGVKIYN